MWVCTYMYKVEDPKKFTLEVTHKIGFMPKEDPAEVSANNCATKEAADVWRSVQTCIYWHAKWTQKGFDPGIRL